MDIQYDSLSNSIPYVILNSSASNGARLPGVTATSAGLNANYWRDGSDPVGITLNALASISASFSSGGFVEVNSTTMSGRYRLDVPNAAFVSGPNWVLITIQGASGMVPSELRADLVGWNPQSQAISAGEIGTAVWGATRVSSSTAGTFGEAVSGVIAPVTVGTNNDKTGYALSVVGASGVWDVVNNEHSTAGTTGANLLTAASAAGATSSEVATAVWSATRIANSSAGTFGEAVSGVANSVGYVAGSVSGNVVGSVASVTAPVTVGTNNDKTGYTLTSAAYSSTALAVLVQSFSSPTISADTGRNLLNAGRVLRNRVDTTATSGTMTVYLEDDTATAWSATLTTSAAATPVTGIDPS